MNPERRLSPVGEHPPYAPAACIGRRPLEARMPYPARTGSGRIEMLGFHGKITASGNEQGFGKQGRSPVASPSNQ